MRQNFPKLDCHAHISPMITDQQIRKLGSVFVFAVTRSLEESSEVLDKKSDSLLWGCGVHPGRPDALSAYSPKVFSKLITKLFLVGEIGLDRRSKNIELQKKVFKSILEVCESRPLILSVHSAGYASEILDLIEANPHPGIILHWYGGDAPLIKRAISLGCFFSVNTAMSTEKIQFIPKDRLPPKLTSPLLRKELGQISRAISIILKSEYPNCIL